MWRSILLSGLMAACVSTASAEGSLSRLPDGRHVVSFNNLRTVLVEEDSARMTVNLRFRAVPGDKPRELGGDPDREYWPVKRILADPDRFRALLVEAVYFLANHHHEVDPERLKARGGFTGKGGQQSRQLLKVFVMGTYGDEIRGDGRGNGGYIQRRSNSFFARDNPRWVRTEIQGFSVYTAPGAPTDLDNSDSFLPRQDRLFEAGGDLIIACHPLNHCTRDEFSADLSAEVSVQFDYGFPRSAYRDLDLYLHDYIEQIVLPSRPKGIE